MHAAQWRRSARRCMRAESSTGDLMWFAMSALLMFDGSSLSLGLRLVMHLRKRSRPRSWRPLGEFLCCMHHVEHAEAACLVAGQSIGMIERARMDPDPTGAERPGALNGGGEERPA